MTSTSRRPSARIDHRGLTHLCYRTTQVPTAPLPPNLLRWSEEGELPALDTPIAYYGYLSGPQLKTSDTACFVTAYWYARGRGLPFPEAVVRMNWLVFRRRFARFSADRDRALRGAALPEVTEKALYLAGPQISKSLRYSCDSGGRCAWETKAGQGDGALAALLNTPYFASRARAVSLIAHTGRSKAKDIVRELKAAARAAVLMGGDALSTDLLSSVDEKFLASLRRMLETVKEAPLRSAAELGAQSLQGEAASSEEKTKEESSLLLAKALCDLLRAAVRSEDLYAPVDLASAQGLSRLCTSYLKRCSQSGALECKHVTSQLEEANLPISSLLAGTALADRLEEQLKDSITQRCVVNAAAERVTDEIALALAVPQNPHWSRFLREQGRASDLWEDLGGHAASHPTLRIPMSLRSYFARLVARTRGGSDPEQDHSLQALYRALFEIQGLRHTATKEMTSALARKYAADMERYAEMGRTGVSKTTAGAQERRKDHPRYQGALVPAREPPTFEYPEYHPLIPRSTHAQGLLNEREALSVLNGFAQDMGLAGGEAARAPRSSRVRPPVPLFPKTGGSPISSGAVGAQHSTAPKKSATLESSGSVPKGFAQDTGSAGGKAAQSPRSPRVRPPVPLFPKTGGQPTSSGAVGAQHSTAPKKPATHESSGSMATSSALPHSLADAHHDRNSCYSYSIIYSICFSDGPFWSGMVRYCPLELRRLLEDAHSSIRSEGQTPNLAMRFRAIREAVGVVDARFSRSRGRPQDPTEFYATLARMAKAEFLTESVLRTTTKAPGGEPEQANEKSTGSMARFPLELEASDMSQCVSYTVPAWTYVDSEGRRVSASETRNIYPLPQEPSGDATPVCLYRSTETNPDLMNTKRVLVTEELAYASGPARLLTLCMATSSSGSLSTRHYICAFRSSGSEAGWSIYNDLERGIRSFADFRALRAAYSDMDRLTVFAVYERK